MGFYDLILIPILFGLVGFIEPCSLGINVIFLNRIKDFERNKRLYETTIFTFVRALILALIGLSAAFIGSRFITIQSSLFIVLGVVYIILGVLSIINIHYPIFKFSINFTNYFRNKGAFSLGFIFGLIIPACAIAFVIALIGNATLSGNSFNGFISLFLFGIALSSPLIFISYFKKSIQIVQKLADKTRKFPWLAGVVLILIGILTILTSVWWSGALA